MARVEDWFFDFVPQHIQRFPRPDWPEPASEFWGTWKKAFVRNGLTFDVADQSSTELAEAPPPHVDRHLESLLAKAKTVRVRAQAMESGASDRETAVRLSAGCGHCGGSGMAPVYLRPGWDSRTASAAAHCVCPLGRMNRGCFAKDPGTLARIPDLASVLAGSTGWTVEQPGLPAYPDDVFNATAALKHLIACHKAEKPDSGRRAAPTPKPLTDAEARFSGGLGATEAVAFASLHPTARERVMRAGNDPVMRAEADALLGRAPTTLDDAPGNSHVDSRVEPLRFVKGDLSDGQETEEQPGPRAGTGPGEDAGRPAPEPPFDPEPRRRGPKPGPRPEPEPDPGPGPVDW